MAKCDLNQLSLERLQSLMLSDSQRKPHKILGVIIPYMH